MTDQAAPQCYRHPGRETWISCQRCGRPICPDCMIPASVGFQCPNCVNEGRKSVRSPRTAFGGLGRSRPEQTTIVLIAINLFVWLLTVITGGAGSRITQYLALTPKGTCVASGDVGYFPGATRAACSSLGHWVAGATDGAPWQVLTSAFLHVEPQHVAMNMISLWFLGPPLEMLLGRARFLTVYLVAALTGSGAVILFSDAHAQTLGASGAIFGLLGALLILSRRNRALYQQVVFWLMINLVFTFVVPGISWQAHIGGLIGGAAATAIIMRTPSPRR